MGRFGLLGERLSHSFSPLIHAELGDYEYSLYEKKSQELEEFIQHGDFDGLNVTIPYKKEVIPFCGGLSGAAQTIGSVNTITRRPDGSLYGDNTDFFGFGYLLRKAKVNPVDGKTLVLGSGGSSLTVQAVLRDMKESEIVIISRNGTDHYENIKKHRDAIMIINTTPVGMYPNNGVSPLFDIGIFYRCRAVIDLIYNPSRSELLLQAEERGILSVNGLTMLVAQAKKSAEYFLNKSIPDEQIEKITAKIACQTQNIILIGMPGCGKTSIGAALAKKMGRDFIDTDEEVEKAAGKSIPAIFADDGEENFRLRETKVMNEFCKKSSMIIATGGGAVTQAENRRFMRQNGIIVFLDREIRKLSVEGRPLSQRDGVEKLSAVRLPLYKEWSDYIIPVRGVEQTAADIYEILYGGVFELPHCKMFPKVALDNIP